MSGSKIFTIGVGQSLSRMKVQICHPPPVNKEALKFSVLGIPWQSSG